MEINTKTERTKKAAKQTRFQCTICPKTFLYARSLNEHVLTKHVDENEKEYDCKQCFKNSQLTKSFVTEALLKKHIKLVHAPRFKCQVCLKTFQKQLDLTIHLRTHSINDTKNYMCSFCSKSFYRKGALQSHLLNVHNEKRKDFIYFKCEFCSQDFASRFKLENHVVKKHVVDKEFECLVCSKKFIDQETLDKHMKRHDRRILHVCNMCSKTFNWRQSLLEHLALKHGEFFYCEKCKRSFKQKSQFDEHESDSTQELKCYICQEILNSECNHKIHTDSHVKQIKAETTDMKVEIQIEPTESDNASKLEPTKIKCELCPNIFDREAYFKAHRMLVHPNAEWKCNFEQCSKSFKAYNKLKRHKMEHAETKEFVCDICQKSFYHPFGLRNHKRGHAEENKYKCESCPKSFRAPYYLTQHISSIHGGPRPFKCPVTNCGASWSSNVKLKRHLISHETEKMFKCEFCTKLKAFKYLGGLKRHHQEVHLNSKGIKVRGPKTKYADAIVFLCSSKECSFETGNHEKVAIHYSEQHGLPKVIVVPSETSVSLRKERRKCQHSSLIQKRFKCDICFKYIKLRNSYGHHKRDHLNETPFQCTQCPKSFKHPNNLKTHIRKVHGKR